MLTQLCLENGGYAEKQDDGAVVRLRRAVLQLVVGNDADGMARRALVRDGVRRLERPQVQPPVRRVLRQVRARGLLPRRRRQVRDQRRPKVGVGGRLRRRRRRPHPHPAEDHDRRLPPVRRSGDGDRRAPGHRLVGGSRRPGVRGHGCDTPGRRRARRSGPAIRSIRWVPCYHLHLDASDPTADEARFTIDTSGVVGGIAIFAQHVPTEFERDSHYLIDASGVDIEPVADMVPTESDHGGRALEESGGGYDMYCVSQECADRSMGDCTLHSDDCSMPERWAYSDSEALTGCPRQALRRHLRRRRLRRLVLQLRVRLRPGRLRRPLGGGVRPDVPGFEPRLLRQQVRARGHEV